jgi:hypothetical protein
VFAAFFVGASEDTLIYSSIDPRFHFSIDIRFRLHDHDCSLKETMPISAGCTSNVDGAQTIENLPQVLGVE